MNVIYNLSDLAVQCFVTKFWLNMWQFCFLICCCPKRNISFKTSKRQVGKAHTVLITAILLTQRLSCYWGKIVSRRTNLRLADLRPTTAQQRSTRQNLPSLLYYCWLPLVWRQWFGLVECCWRFQHSHLGSRPRGTHERIFRLTVVTVLTASNSSFVVVSWVFVVGVTHWTDVSAALGWLFPLGRALLEEPTTVA
jgi:hypothetical protein